MPKKEVFDINCRLLVETPKAIRIDDGKTQCWLPKSQIEFESNGDGTITVTGPIWLMKEKGLV